MNPDAAQPLLIADFEKGNVDPGAFDHRAHVHLAWSYLQNYPLVEVIERFDAALMRLVRKLGATNKYHATITWFFLILVAERCTPGESWQDFSARNRDIVENSRDTLGAYYDSEVLQSERARRQFILPNPRRKAA